MMSNNRPKHLSLVSNEELIASRVDPTYYSKVGVIRVSRDGKVVKLTEQAEAVLFESNEVDRSVELIISDIFPNLKGRNWHKLVETVDECQATKFVDRLPPLRGSKLIECVARTEALESAIDIIINPLTAEKTLLKYYETLFRTSHMDLVIKSNDGKYLAASDAFLNTFDLKREEVIGQSVFDFFPPEFAEHVTTHDNLVYEHGTTVSQVDSIPKGDKSLLVTKIPIQFEADNDSFDGLASVAIDISQLAKKVNRNDLKNQQNSDFLKLSADLLFETDKDWNITYSNLDASRHVSGIRLNVGEDLMFNLTHIVRDTGSLYKYIENLRIGSISNQQFTLSNNLTIKLGIISRYTMVSDVSTLIYRGTISIIHQPNVED